MRLDVLEKWVRQRSFLFLGYKQFSVMFFSDNLGNKVAYTAKGPYRAYSGRRSSFRKRGNQVLQSLAQVQTTLRVVLSGMLYQNHVKEVFNILNLFCPEFLKSKTSREIVNRIMSRVHILKARSHLRTGTDSAFI
ncbi:hypothetical protein OIU76_015438 [Salix suchowensis]|nr:hypothetical protein OIU76_015438 [Salix suchowensis]